MITVDDTGARADDLDTVHADLLRRLRDAFGGDLSVSPQTPQGQIAGIVAAALVEQAEAIVADVQAGSVDHASGSQLDALGSLLGVRRREATRTIVAATLTGVSGGTVPAGSLARSGDESFRLIEDAALSPAGRGAEFEAVTPGPVACPAGSLDRIETPVPGWETVANAADGVLGSDRQTDASYRADILLRSARSATGPASALEAAVLDAGASRVRVVENPTPAAVAEQGFRLPPHSVLVVADGGLDADVERAVENHRGMGVAPVAAIIGAAADPSVFGTLIWDGDSYTAGTRPPDDALAAAAESALDGVWMARDATTPSVSRMIATYAWRPGVQPVFSGSLADRLGLDGTAAAYPAGPFARPRPRALSVSLTLERRAGFPADGLERVRGAVTERVAAYGIGEQLWLNDLLQVAEAVPGTRITGLTATHGGVAASGADTPLDGVWVLDVDGIDVAVT